MIRMGEAKGKIFNCLVVAAVVILAAFAGTVLYAQGNDYPPGPEPKDIRIVDVDPSSIPADGMSEATITARATNGTDASNNYKLKFEIVAQPGDDAYLTTSEWDDHNSGPLVGNTTNINGYAYAKLKAGTTVGQVEIEVYRIKGSDISDTAIISLTEPGGKPDLKVTELRANCGELFANASNIINATIDNIGTNASGAFNVSFDTGSFSKEVRVNDLAVNGTTIVSVTDPTQRHAGESVTISVTVDCDSEETTEDNNAISIVKEVVNNGYKGKSVAGLPSLVLLEHQKIRGNLVYTVGNSSKVELEPANTTTTGFNITIPDSASLKTARLYVYWYDSYSSTEHGDADLTVVVEGHSFTTPDAMYTDEKGFGSYNYPKGTYVYDVSSAISGTGTYAAIMENGANNTSTVLTGQMLLVVYEEGSEPEREYWITEGCDLLMVNSKYCVSPGEAIANVTLEGEIANATNKSARLITVVAQGNEQGTDLTFNEQVWEDVWQDYAGNSKLCIDDRSVIPAASDNVVGFRDTGTMGMQASNAILVVCQESGGANAPSVTTANASLPIIPEDTDNEPLWGELTNLSVVVTDDTAITSVTVDLSSIGGDAMQTMTPGGDNVWYYETNASIGSAKFETGSYESHLLRVTATNEEGKSNTSVSIAVTVMKNGDVQPYEGDGEVDFMHDALFLVRHTKSVPGYETLRDNIADVTEDGEVDFMHDALYLVRYAKKVPGYDVLH